MKVLLSALLLTFSMLTHGQSVTGSWYGRADLILDGSHNNYLTELVLKQKGKEVEGVLGYYFKNNYQSFIVRGRYESSRRLLLITQVPLLYFRSTGEKKVDCIMDFEATLMVSQIKSTLKGYFLRDPHYKYTCPDLTVNFTRNIEETNADSLLEATTPVSRIWQPSKEEQVITPAVLTEKKIQAPPPEMRKFEERKPYLVNEINVTSDSLRVTLYDNGDIDGDSVSVFFNKVPVLMNKELSAQGFNLYLHLDTTTAVNEISMFAENLGRIPPNTALMIIHDGTQRFEVFLTSTFQMNGTVRIRRVKPQ